MRQIADCICEFVLTAWRWFQSGNKFENTPPKCVQTRVIPRARWFAWLWFFSKIDEFHLRVHKNCAAFADILTARDRDDRFGIVRKIHDPVVIHRADQNIAIAQNEWGAACEVVSKIDDTARPILYGLYGVFDIDIVMPAVTEKILHCLGMIADNK